MKPLLRLVAIAVIMLIATIAAFSVAVADERPAKPSIPELVVDAYFKEATKDSLQISIVVEIQELPPPNPQYDGPPFVINPYGEGYYWDSTCQCWVWISRYFGLLTQEVEPDTTGGG